MSVAVVDKIEVCGKRAYRATGPGGVGIVAEILRRAGGAGAAGCACGHDGAVYLVHNA